MLYHIASLSNYFDRYHPDVTRLSTNLQRPSDPWCAQHQSTRVPLQHNILTISFLSHPALLLSFATSHIPLTNITYNGAPSLSLYSTTSLATSFYDWAHKAPPPRLPSQPNTCRSTTFTIETKRLSLLPPSKTKPLSFSKISPKSCSTNKCSSQPLLHKPIFSSSKGYICRQILPYPTGGILCSFVVAITALRLVHKYRIVQSWVSEGTGLVWVSQRSRFHSGLVKCCWWSGHYVWVRSRGCITVNICWSHYQGTMTPGTRWSAVPIMDVLKQCLRVTHAVPVQRHNSVFGWP